MEQKFIRAFTTFALVVAILVAIALICLGIAILRFPGTFLTALTDTVGSGCLISGIAIIGKLLFGLIKNALVP